MNRSETYSISFNDSTISSFLILRENNRFTNMDRENVIAAVKMKFVGDMDGKM